MRKLLKTYFCSNDGQSISLLLEIRKLSRLKAGNTVFWILDQKVVFHLYVFELVGYWHRCCSPKRDTILGVPTYGVPTCIFFVPAVEHCRPSLLHFQMLTFVHNFIMLMITMLVLYDWSKWCMNDAVIKYSAKPTMVLHENKIVSQMWYTIIFIIKGTTSSLGLQIYNLVNLSMFRLASPTPPPPRFIKQLLQIHWTQRNSHLCG